MFKQETIDLKIRAFSVYMTPSTVVVAGHLADLLDKSEEGHIFISLARLSAAVHMAPRTVTRAVDALRRDWIIDWIPGTGTGAVSVARFPKVVSK